MTRLKKIDAVKRPPDSAVEGGILLGSRRPAAQGSQTDGISSRSEAIIFGARTGSSAATTWQERRGALFSVATMQKRAQTGRRSSPAGTAAARSETNEDTPA